MSYYPIFVDLRGKTVLVVGGGQVAQRKIETLLEFGPEIRVVSKEITEALAAMIAEKKIQHAGTLFEEDMLEGVSLVITATDNAQLNHHVSEVAKKRAVLVNAVDQPADCDFIVPSVVRRGDLVIAISTMGKSPALAKQIRKQLEAQFDEAYGTFLALMGIIRSRVLALGLPTGENSRIFESLVSSHILRDIREENLDGVRAALESILPSGLAPADILNEMGKLSGGK